MKTLALRKMNLLFALLVVAWAHQADARTYLDDCANNGVILKSQISLGYLDTAGVPASATFSTFAPGAPVPGGFDHVTTNLGPVLIVNPTTFGSTATTPPLLVKTPPVGQAKDRVEVEAEQVRKHFRCDRIGIGGEAAFARWKRKDRVEEPAIGQTVAEHDDARRFGLRSGG